jgi:hypothetical protein
MNSNRNKVATTFLLTSQTFLNRCEEQYRNIITINFVPGGPLEKYVVRLQMPRLSHFECYNEGGRCVLALRSFRSFGLMGDDEIPDLFAFLLANGYTIDTNLTNMMNAGPVKLSQKKIIGFVTYLG